MPNERQVKTTAQVQRVAESMVRIEWYEDTAGPKYRVMVRNAEGIDSWDVGYSSVKTYDEAYGFARGFILGYANARLNRVRV